MSKNPLRPPFKPSRKRTEEVDSLPIAGGASEAGNEEGDGEFFKARRLEEAQSPLLIGEEDKFRSSAQMPFSHSPTFLGQAPQVKHSAISSAFKDPGLSLPALPPSFLKRAASQDSAPSESQYSQNSSECGYVRSPSALPFTPYVPDPSLSSQEAASAEDSHARALDFREFVRRTNEKDLTIYYLRNCLKTLFSGVNMQEALAGNVLRILDIGCGEGTLLTKIAISIKKLLSETVKDFTVSVSGIDKDEEFIKKTREKILRANLTEGTLIAGDCFSEDLDSLPGTPHIIIVSHIAYYCDNIKLFVEKILNKSGPNTIILFAHQSELSGVNIIRDALASKVNTAVSKKINNILETSTTGFVKSETLLGSFIKLPESVESLVTLAQHSTKQPETSNALTRIVEFLVQQRLADIVASQHLSLLTDMINEISIGEREVIFWDQIQVLTPRTSVFAEHITMVFNDQSMFSNFTTFSPIHLAALQGSSEVMARLIESATPDILSTEALGFITPLYLTKLSCYRGHKKTGTKRTIDLILEHTSSDQKNQLKDELFLRINWLCNLVTRSTGSPYKHPIEHPSETKFAKRPIWEKIDIISRRFPFLLKDPLLMLYCNYVTSSYDLESGREVMIEQAIHFLEHEFCFYLEHKIILNFKDAVIILDVLDKFYLLMDYKHKVGELFERAINLWIGHEDLTKKDIIEAILAKCVSVIEHHVTIGNKPKAALFLKIANSIIKSSYDYAIIISTDLQESIRTVANKFTLSSAKESSKNTLTRARTIEGLLKLLSENTAAVPALQRSKSVDSNKDRGKISEFMKDSLTTIGELAPKSFVRDELKRGKTASLEKGSIVGIL